MVLTRMQTMQVARPVALGDEPAMMTGGATTGADGLRHSWVQLLPQGTYETERHGKLDFSRAALAKYKASFDKRARGIDIALDVDHKAPRENDTRAAGWIERVELGEAINRPAGLWALVRWTPYGQGLVAAQEYRYISAEVTPGAWTNEILGETFDHVISGMTLTNRPVMKNMAAIELGERRGGGGVWRVLEMADTDLEQDDGAALDEQEETDAETAAGSFLFATKAADDGADAGDEEYDDESGDDESGDDEMADAEDEEDGGDDEDQEEQPPMPAAKKASKGKAGKGKKSLAELVDDADVTALSEGDARALLAELLVERQAERERVRRERYAADVAKVLGGWDAGTTLFAEAKTKNPDGKGAKLVRGGAIRVALSRPAREAAEALLLSDAVYALSEEHRTQIARAIELAATGAVDLSVRGSSFDQEARKTTTAKSPAAKRAERETAGLTLSEATRDVAAEAGVEDYDGLLKLAQENGPRGWEAGNRIKTFQDEAAKRIGYGRDEQGA